MWGVYGKHTNCSIFVLYRLKRSFQIISLYQFLPSCPLVFGAVPNMFDGLSNTRYIPLVGLVFQCFILKTGMAGMVSSRVICLTGK